MPKSSSLDAASLVAAVQDAARRWTNADFPPRVRVQSAIAKRTGYTLPVVEYALDRLFNSLDEATLTRAIVEDLGSLEVLDRFVERNEKRVRAWPIGKVVVVSSQTTIGVGITPAIYALCAKCSVLVKDREDALVAAFFQTVIDAQPALRRVLEARSWKGGSEGDVDITLADAVVAFGHDETLSTLRALMRPGARFIGYGHRASIGYVDRAALSDDAGVRTAARGAARDLVLYDGEGCMSLHALFVERGGALAPSEFAKLLIEAVNDASIEFPAGRLDPRVATYCTGAVFRAALGRGSVFRTTGGEASLVLDPPFSEPPPLLPRLLPVYSVDGPEECEEYVRSHALPLEAFAVATPSEPLAQLAARVGAARIARLGEMQAPSPALHHGGRTRIADFIRWIDA